MMWCKQGIGVLQKRVAFPGVHRLLPTLGLPTRPCIVPVLIGRGGRRQFVEQGEGP